MIFYLKYWMVIIFYEARWTFQSRSPESQLRKRQNSDSSQENPIEDKKNSPSPSSPDSSGSVNLEFNKLIVSQEVNQPAKVILSFYFYILYFYSDPDWHLNVLWNRKIQTCYGKSISKQMTRLFRRRIKVNLHLNSPAISAVTGRNYKGYNHL